MSKRPIAKSKKQPPQRGQSLWVRAAMALSLVPIIAGAVLIILWALDLYLWQGDPIIQAYVGLFFILSGFAISNLLQKHWILAAGWALISAADLLLLTFIVYNVQVLAILLGALGIVLLLYEFVRRMQEQQKN